MCNESKRQTKAMKMAIKNSKSEKEQWVLFAKYVNLLRVVDGLKPTDFSKCEWAQE